MRPGAWNPQTKKNSLGLPPKKTADLYLFVNKLWTAMAGLMTDLMDEIEKDRLHVKLPYQLAKWG